MRSFDIRRPMVSLAITAFAALSGAQLYGISYDTGEIYDGQPVYRRACQISDNTGPVAGIADLVRRQQRLGVRLYGVGANGEALLV